MPEDGTYRVEVWGAQGGVNHSGREGGLGARMRGDFTLSAGERLHLVVGQKGIISPSGNSANGGSGGGGGTFVWRTGADQPLIVAGGGGGSGLHNNGDDASRGAHGTTSTSGTRAKDNQGQGGTNGSDAPNGGGRGWNTVRNNATGGSRMNTYGGDGGFGGGGVMVYVVIVNWRAVVGATPVVAWQLDVTTPAAEAGLRSGASQQAQAAVRPGHGQARITRL